ncbi:hypothetical protein R3P38DRAFT_1161363 [Favolaschia claudopus]|uniref:BRCT domain-containing protein n=1 Tax=Favolaschia claudopus TaxID=2862362 RepID=A0AAW0E1X9_9AGAR
MNDLFERIKFFLSETLPPRRQAELAKALEGNGARRADAISSATHYITNSNPNPPIEAENVQIVSDYWVDRAMVLGSIPPCEFYSVEAGKIFSGIVGCASGISVADQTMIEAGITSLGGQWRHGLSKDVTHLFATNPDSDRYAAAMELRKNSKDHTHLMKVLLPHWFDDAFRIGSGKLPTTAYEWPDPKVLHPMSSLEELQTERATTRRLSTAKHMFFKTAVWNPEKVTPFPGPAAPLGNIWNGRKILLSLNLGLDNQRRQVVEAAVKQAGGLIVEIDDEDEENEGAVDCDVFITKWRSGEAFITAFNQTKIIGTLNWLLFVHATGTVSNPLDQLPHYPIRKTPPLHDTQHLITVTNYTGPAREYLKRLINLLGWNFSPGMSGQNTVIIAAHMGGEKTQRAMAWEIPVVNHMWLEDCFAGWKAITPALSKYIEFPPNVDFAPMLAERTLDVNPDALSNEEDEDRDGRPPVGTEASAKEVESLLEDMDTPSNPKRKSSRLVVPPSVSPMKNRSADDEDMIMDELPELPSAPVRVEKKKIVSAKSRGKQPDRSAEDSKKSSERPKLQHAEDAEASEMETSPTTQHNRKGKAKEKPAKTPNKVTFAADTAGPSNSRPSNKKAASTAVPAPKRKVQAMESVSDDEATDEVPSEDEPPKKRAKKKSTPSTANPAPKRKLQVTEAASDNETAHESQSDDEPPKKRAKVNKTTTATVAATTASSSKRKMTAGPGKDSTPRQPERTESINALADERANVWKTGTKRKQPEASSSAAGSKSKKKSSRVEEDDAEMLSDVENRTLDERTQRERGGSGKKGADVIDVDDVAPPKTTKAKAQETTKKATKKSKASANTSGESRKSAGPVKLLTTGMVLPDNVLKTLSKLGVTTASNGSDCTHLVAQNLIRTEKLLCALASGAFILSDKWAIESAEANKLLPESNYILRDKTNEKKWNFRLADAIERVKEVRGKLFEGKTFYVTSKVSIDRKLLKTVVGAQGGKVMTSNPTIRVLNSAPYRYVISCPEDVSLWRSLTKHHTIYSQELLLSAALTQQIDWKNPDFQLKAEDDTA